MKTIKTHKNLDGTGSLSDYRVAPYVENFTVCSVFLQFLNVEQEGNNFNDLKISKNRVFQAHQSLHPFCIRERYLVQILGQVIFK